MGKGGEAIHLEVKEHFGWSSHRRLGGIPFAEYMRRQEQHRQAEIAATIDAVPFMDRAGDIYGYNHFICDTSGSICEVVDADDPDDPVLTALHQNSLIIWLRGSDAHLDTLVARFNKAPKPMYTRTDAMTARWTTYLDQTGLDEAAVDPDDFIRWSYRQILHDRLPLYQNIADKWGITVDASALSGIRDASEFYAIIADRLPD